MSTLKTLLIIIALFTIVLVPSNAQYTDTYCGQSIGYNLTSLGLTDIFRSVNDNNGNPVKYYVNICSKIQHTQCNPSFNPIGCAMNYDESSILINFRSLSQNPWSMVNVSDYRQGYLWTSQAAYSNNVWSRAEVTLTCDPTAITPRSDSYQFWSGNTNRYTFTMQTNRICSPPSFASASSSSTGVSTGPSPTSPPAANPTSAPTSNPTWSTGSTSLIAVSTGIANNGTCAGLQLWYFSYTAIISSTYTINFYGTFYTASGVPTEIRVLQVYQIQATWVIAVNGATTMIPVTVLNPNLISGINVNGGTLYPLQGQSWSFYVGSELVTIGGNGVYPVMLNSTTVIQSGTFIVSNNPQHVGQSGC